MTGREVKERELVGFEARLLPMLLEAVEENRVRAVPRPSPRRFLFRRTAAVALAAAALVVATTVVVGGRSTIEVHAADALADPEGVVTELRDAGIEARILVVPVDRRIAGTWWFASVKAQPGARLPYRMPWFRRAAERAGRQSGPDGAGGRGPDPPGMPRDGGGRPRALERIAAPS